MSELPLIYDFGMHSADDTEVYLKKGFRVVAIEADPALCVLARLRLAKDIETSNLIILNRAIGSGEGVLDFHVCNEDSRLSTASHALLEERSRDGMTFRAEKIDFTTADNVLGTYGPARYVKIDIEGHDLMCLEQIAASGISPDYLSFEVDFKTYRRAVAVCRKMGFTRFAMVAQRHVGGSIAPSPSKEGNSIDHTFALGESGPFGDDLNVEWQTARRVTLQCFAIYYQMKLHGLMRRLGLKRYADRIWLPILSWYDIHAGR